MRQTCGRSRIGSITHTAVRIDRCRKTCKDTALMCLSCVSGCRFSRVAVVAPAPSTAAEVERDFSMCEARIRCPFCSSLPQHGAIQHVAGEKLTSQHRTSPCASAIYLFFNSLTPLHSFPLSSFPLLRLPSSSA